MEVVLPKISISTITHRSTVIKDPSRQNPRFLVLKSCLEQ
jgi:tmRNA-binding protein